MCANVLGRTPSHWMLCIGMLALIHPAIAHGQEGGDSSEAAAIKAIADLGGTVRRVAANTKEQEIEFRLGGGELNDEGLAHVARVSDVVMLNLKGTKITDAGLVHLKGLTKLRKLHLEQTDVGDEGIAHLVGLTELEYLNLYATNVTDQSLQRLESLKKLRRLYLWQTDVTDEAVADLEEALPQLAIIRGASLDSGSAARRRIVMDDPPPPLAGQPWKLAGIRYEDGAPGAKAEAKVYFRAKGQTEFTAVSLTRDGDGPFAGAIPATATSKPLQYYIRIREPKQAPSTFPSAGGREPAGATPDVSPPVLAEAPQTKDVKSYHVALSWKAASDDLGVAAYHIYRGKDAGQLIAKENLLAQVKPDQLAYTDAQPPAGQSAIYAVAPIDVAGRQGEPKSVAVDVPKDTPPENQLKLAAAAGSKAVVLDWSGEVEPDVRELLVYRADAADAEPKQVAVVKVAEAKNWLDKDVKDDVDYRYTIKLRDVGGLVSKASPAVIASAGGFLRRINCGGPKIASADGADWEADSGSVSGTGRFTAKEKVAAAPAGLQDVYQTERWSYRGVRYRLEAAPGHYRATLHFAETNNAFAAAGKRTFDVLINGKRVQEKVDVFAKAGKATAWSLPIDFEVTGDEINIELRKVSAGPAIKGLEVREIAKE